MTNIDQQEAGPKFQRYFEVQSPEEGLYGILQDFADGKLTASNLTEMSDMWLNAFPPVEFFAHRSGTALAQENVRQVMASVKSPADFAQTELFREIMADQSVVNRFQKASAHFGINGYPTHWPNEYRRGTAKPQEVTGWREKLKKFFNLN